MCRRRRSLVLGAAVLVALALTAAGEARAQERIPGGEGAEPVALVGGMLLDGYEAPPIQRGAVLVRGDTIVDVGRMGEVEIPDDARVIDTSGRTMLPGLIDLHVHLMILGHGSYDDWFPFFEDRKREIMRISARQLLEAGVTTAADMGAPMEILTVRDRIEAGEIPGPRMHVSGPWITRAPCGEDSYPCYFQHSIDSPEEAAAAARELADAGVDLIKTWVGMEEEDIRAVDGVADEAGLQVHSHLYHPKAAWGAIRGGTDVIQHAGSAGEYPYRDSLIREIAYNDIPVVPTMAHRIWVVPSTNDFRTRLHDPELAEDFPEEIHREVRSSFERTEFHRLDYYSTTPRQIRHAEMGAASQFIEANAVVAMGTDSGTPANFHTEAAWREIVAMVESGMSPHRAIVASTKIPAQVLGVFDEVGTIEPGKKADVIVVDGNPLRFVEKLDQVLYVMKDGVVYEGSEH